MTEFSYLWTTSGTPSGDQVSGYTQSHWRVIAGILAACSGFEGIGPAFLNELACSDGGANTVDVATGGAVVDGKPYQNNAVVNVNIPSAVGGGNTRIDRIVLRASWSAFTVRITRIAGADAASPTPPDIVQTSETTYDIQLCQVLVDTSGNVTVTDERVWAIIDTDGATLEATSGALNVLAGGIGTTQLADNSVDDLKAGNRVPQFYRRQGGDASNWSSGGTTTYTPTSVRIQAGVYAWSHGALSADDSGAVVSISFPTSFSNVPIILVNTTERNLKVGWEVQLSSGFDINYYALAAIGAATELISWIAIGPE